MFWYVAERMGVANQLKLAGQVAEGETCYIAFSPNLDTSSEYAALLSDGVQELRRTGALQKILQKYGVKDWKEGITVEQSK